MNGAGNVTTFHTDSDRNPDGFHQDSGPHSALKKAASLAIACICVALTVIP